MDNYDKRRFLKTLMAFPVVTSAGMLSGSQVPYSQENAITAGGHKLKISLNAYSFNDPLSKGTMNLETFWSFARSIILMP